MIQFVHLLSFCCSVAKSCSIFLRPHGLQPVRLLCPWDSPGKNTGVGCHFLFQGNLPTRDQTHISCIAGGLFTAEPSGNPHASLYSTSKIQWNQNRLKKSILNFNKHRFSAYNTPNTLLGSKEIEVNKAESLISSNPILKIAHLSGRINAILLSINIQQE